MLNFTLLHSLYYAYSPSYQEFAVSSIVKQELNRLNIPFTESKHGNIYRIRKNQPLLSAHMDMVAFSPIRDLDIDEVSGDIRATNKTSLGADDKNGVFIALQLLTVFPYLSFCFSVCEESGGGLWYETGLEAAITKKSVPFALVFDRRDNKDIIGASNGYCTEEFEKALCSLISPLGYSPTIGTFSDANFFRDFCNSVNLSCGYYGAHTVMEYANMFDIEKAFGVGRVIIENADKLRGFIKPPKKTRFSSALWSWSSSKHVEAGEHCCDCGLRIKDTGDKYNYLGGQLYCDSCFGFYRSIIASHSK